jgi:hypothetical protein
MRVKHVLLAGFCAAAGALAITLAGCASAPQSASQQAGFLASLHMLCGQSFAGRVVTTDAADASFADSRLVMHVRECSFKSMQDLT